MGITIRNSLNLGQLKEQAERSSGEALQAAADHVRDVARDRAPILSGPVDLKKANQDRRAHPGELRESAYSLVVENDRAEVGFSAYYAGWQHERMDYHHTAGGPKFLETALDTEADEALRIMAEKLRDGIQ